MRKGKHKPCKEIPQVDELAVILILDVDDAPFVLASAYLLTVDDHISLRTHNGERNHVLFRVCEARCISSEGTKRDK